MVLSNKIVLHIPEKAWINEELIDIPVKKSIKSLMKMLSDYDFYSQRIKSHYKNKKYPETIITIFCNDGADDIIGGTDDIINIFIKWFKDNNDILKQESYAYELNNSLYIIDASESDRKNI